MQERRQPEIIAGRVNSDGSIAAGDGFTVQKTGTGAYQLTFPGNFRFTALTVSVISPLGFAISAGGASPTANTYNVSSTPTDMAWSFVAVGVQT